MSSGVVTSASLLRPLNAGYTRLLAAGHTRATKRRNTPTAHTCSRTKCDVSRLLSTMRLNRALPIVAEPCASVACVPRCYPIPDWWQPLMGDRPASIQAAPSTSSFVDSESTHTVTPHRHTAPPRSDQYLTSVPLGSSRHVLLKFLLLSACRHAAPLCQNYGN
ncbi:hypothetical protein CBL_04541 [Carabus blaptoides fortunei]